MAEPDTTGVPTAVEVKAPLRELSCVTLPTFSEASALVSCRYSCLVVETHQRHIALSPKYLKRKRSGIQEQLNSELLKYNEGLEGVPVAYDNIKLVGELGDIYDDLGHIHINIEADFVIFRPKFSQKLVGVVNKVAPSHIGCLVHGCFNASIPKPPKMSMEIWQHIGVKIDDQMEFEVSRLDSDAVGVFCIRGRLDKRIEAKAFEKSNEANAEQNVEDDSSEAANVPEAVNVETELETNVDSQQKTKKKSKKRKFQDNISQENELGLENVSREVESSGETTTLNSNVENSNGLMEETPKKKRKREKHKDVLSQNREFDSGRPADGDTASVAETNMLDTQNLILLTEAKQRKSKKKKHQDILDQKLNSSFPNGMAEDAGFPDCSLLDESGLEVSDRSPDQRKKKHKNSSLVQDPANNLVNSDFSEVPAAENLPNAQVMSKVKRPKKKHQKNASLESDFGNYQGIDQSRKAAKRTFSEDHERSLTPSEPKAKKKRKE
ncbi:DNA-directed RNA polymerase I subunit RPA43 [Rhinophrynus dorsalis]